MKPTTLRSLRQWHHLIGVFLAPAILFFSFSGLIQVLGSQDQRVVLAVCLLRPEDGGEIITGEVIARDTAVRATAPATFGWSRSDRLKRSSAYAIDCADACVDAHSLECR